MHLQHSLCFNLTGFRSMWAVIMTCHINDYNPTKSRLHTWNTLDERRLSPSVASKANLVGSETKISASVKPRRMKKRAIAAAKAHVDSARRYLTTAPNQERSTCRSEVPTLEPQVNLV